MEAERLEGEYKVINLQNLEDRPHKGGMVSHQDLCEKLNDGMRWFRKKPLYYADTGASNQRIIPDNEMFRTNSFFSAFHEAYMQHGDIVLNPDEVWLMIMSYVSHYIENRSNELRNKLVMHEGFKELKIEQEINPYVPNDEYSESCWNEFFDQILQQIRKNTVEGVVEIFECNFTTTKRIHKIVSTAMIMNSFKNLFKYVRLLGGCGINNVYMSGVREDWLKIQEKIKKLTQFDIDGKLKEYIQNMEEILENFVKTFDGKPDVAWWNTVMKTPQMRADYGGQAMEIKGWILNFFGMNEGRLTSFPNLSVKVPIKEINLISKTEKNLFLVGDWTSVSKVNERTYKPDIAVCVVVADEKSL